MDLKFSPREDAVSPVIGVILMVAITVILAAVIAAFVFGMAGGVQKTKTVAASAKQDGSAYIVTWQGGQDNAYVTGYNVTVDCNNAPVCPLGVAGPVLFPGVPEGYRPIVGNTTRLPYATSGNDHVVVTATFTDGSAQVVLDTYV
ncbi:MAG TPA: type IV pilin N-terminal domain-containing protein [Methanomicrobiales archaeon]|nr:type IV pilin N-terminal domain-containing protein [Methanomicrobiales archaeon]